MTTLIGPPVLGKLNQGDIFTCAASHDYTDCQAWGLIVTARCDLAQEKARIVSYLPVVRFDDWIHRDGREILCDRAHCATLGSLQTFLTQRGYSSSILESQSPGRVYDTLLYNSRLKKRDREQYRKLQHRFEMIQRVRTSTSADRGVSQLRAEFSKLCDDLSRRLVRQEESGYYFLERLEHQGNGDGFVALLREIHSIPASLSRRVAQGLSRHEYEALVIETAVRTDTLSFTATDFAMPIGSMGSPQIEHLLQTISLLFGRIGLDDPDDGYIGALWDRQPSLRCRT